MPNPDRRRALEVLADSPNGCIELVLLALGLSREVLVDLIDDGFATATAQRVHAGGRDIEVTRLRITDAGRRAIGG
jgi:hypothetical protein